MSTVYRCQRPHGEGGNVRTWQARSRLIDVRDYRGIDVVVRQQMLLAPARKSTAGGWMPTKPQAERYSTLVRVDTQ